MVDVFEIINLKVTSFTFKLILNIFLLLLVCKTHQFVHTWVASSAAVTSKKLKYCFWYWCNFYPVHYKRIIILLPAVTLRLWRSWKACKTRLPDWKFAERKCFLNSSLHGGNWWDSIRIKYCITKFANVEQVFWATKVTVKLL